MKKEHTPAEEMMKRFRRGAKSKNPKRARRCALALKTYPVWLNRHHLNRNHQQQDEEEE